MPNGCPLRPHLYLDTQQRIMMTTFQVFDDNETEAFKQTSPYFKDNFEEAYSIPIINWMLLFIYLLGLIGCVGLLLASWFEKTGQAGPYRTLVNQLISSKLDQIVLFYVFGCLLQSVRPVHGPFPSLICYASVVLQTYTGMNIVLLSFSVTLARFAFIWIYKAIPVMDDDFLVKFINGAITVWSAVALASKHYIEDKVQLSERICTGTWSDKDSEMTPVPVATVLGVVILILQTVLLIAIKVGKQIEAPQNNYQVQTTSNLAGLLATHLSTVSLVLAVAAYTVVLLLGNPESLQEYPLALFLHYFTTIGPFFVVWTQCAAQYINNPQLRKAVRRLIIPDRIVSVNEYETAQNSLRNQAGQDVQTHEDLIVPNI